MILIVSPTLFKRWRLNPVSRGLSPGLMNRTSLEPVVLQKTIHTKATTCQRVESNPSNYSMYSRLAESVLETWPSSIE
jgi:hypothetical protein